MFKLTNTLQSNHNDKRGIPVRLLVGLFILVAFASIGVAEAKNKYETNLAFAPDSYIMPIALNENKTEIKPGLAKADMDKLNKEHDVKAIKAYIQELGEEYDVDWKLVYAIGVYESGNYKSSLAQRNNNFFGRKATSATWMQFDTAEEGIRNQFEYLKTRYIERGMDTPAEMNRVYCEGNTWQFKVQYIMDNA